MSSDFRYDYTISPFYKKPIYVKKSQPYNEKEHALKRFIALVGPKGGGIHIEVGPTPFEFKKNLNKQLKQKKMKKR